MNRRRMFALVGALSLAAVMGGAAAESTKAAKAVSCCCGDGCGCASDCRDACCCGATTSKTDAARAVKDESCCEQHAQAAKDANAPCCAAIAEKS